MDDLLILAAILCIVAVVAVFINKRLLTLLLSSAFMLLVAMRLNVPSMYLMGTVLLALPFASWAVGWYGTRGIQVTLTAPETGFEGDDLPVRIDVTCALPAFSALARPRCDLPKWIVAVEGSERTEAIPSGVRQEFVARAERRGVFDLALGAVTVNDPLGIFTISRRANQSRSIVVHPKGLSLQDLKVLKGRSAGWLLDTASGRRGEDDGFFGTREYRFGDDIRRIHWRSSARTGNLVVAERETLVRSTIWICMDVVRPKHRSGDDDSALEHAVRAVVSIMEATLRRGHLVGLYAATSTETRIVPAEGEEQRWRILDALARLPADGDIPLSEVAIQLGAEQGTTVVLVTTEPTVELVTSASRLREAGISVALVAIEAKCPVHASKSFDGALDAASAAALETMVVRLPEKPDAVAAVGE